MTKKNLARFANLFLLFGLLLGAFSVYFSRFNATRQFVVIMLIIAFYLTWGFVYHHMRGDATRKLMFEYLIIGGIAAVTGFFILFS